MNRISVRTLRLAFAVAAIVLPSAAGAAFTDVPKSHFAAEAINYLSERGILNGYKDGTFQPDKKVTRAEAVKIIAAQFIESAPPARDPGFQDVPKEAWYFSSVAWAVAQRGVVDGPPKNLNFHPARAVTKSEFLKMLFAGNGVDMKSFGDIILAISSDVTDGKAWYYPVLRYAVATTTTVVSDAGLIGPNRDLTRGDVALLLHRFLLFRNGQRVQDALTQTKEEVEAIITALSKGDVREAEYASARAILISRGALLAAPDEPVVKVAVKISEGYRALTRAYRASLSGDTDTVAKLASDAAYLAKQAREIDPGSTGLADTLEQHAKSFAKQARR